MGYTIPNTFAMPSAKTCAQPAHAADSVKSVFESTSPTQQRAGTLSPRQIAYREYLKSDHWKQLRKRKLSRARHHCSICGSKHDIDVHHLNYRDWTNVRTSDLRLVCRRCHDLIHVLMKEGKLRFEIGRAHV